MTSVGHALIFLHGDRQRAAPLSGKAAKLTPRHGGLEPGNEPDLPQQGEREGERVIYSREKAVCSEP